MLATAPAQSLSTKAQAFVTQVWALIDQLLLLEAESELRRDAELGASEDAEDMSSDSKRWYGTQVLREEHATLEGRKIGAEYALKKAHERLLTAEIRERGIADAKVEVDQAEATLTDIEEALWALEQQAKDEIAFAQQQAIIDGAARLKTRYLVLSQDFPMNHQHPAVPPFLRRWVQRQQERGALTVEAYRLLVYLIIRETVFNGVLNEVPVLEDEDLPVRNPLEIAGIPASKAEQRMALLLAQQFMHPNGDRRVDRGTPLTELHAARLDAQERESGRFTGRIDFEQGSEYPGLPTLKALVNPAARICAECGGPIKDNVVVRAYDDNQRPGWMGVTACDCTIDEHTGWHEQYDDAIIDMLHRTGHGDLIPQYQEYAALRRAARRREQEPQAQVA